MEGGEGTKALNLQGHLSKIENVKTGASGEDLGDFELEKHTPQRWSLTFICRVLLL